MSESAFGPVRWAQNVPPMLRKDGRPDGTAHHVLLVLATFAKRDGTGARPSIATLADKAYLVTEVAALEALERIEAAGLISRTGDLNGTTVWALNMSVTRPTGDALEARRERARVTNAERQRRFRERSRAARNAVPQRDVTVSDTVTEHRQVTVSQGVSNGVAPRESRRGKPLVTGSRPSQPQVSNGVTAIELPLNYQLINTPAPPALDRDKQFAEFWSAYPRKKEKTDARKSWDKAIKKGVDPEVMIAGSKRYAAENVGQDPQFIKHPATWINKGCWEDEPERHLRAVSGDGYRPYQNPEDQSVYDKDEL